MVPSPSLEQASSAGTAGAPPVSTRACGRCERTRVREHLLAAIERLLRRVPAGPDERTRVAAVVAELVRYAIRGVFPRNATHPVATPIFVDDVGTRCAVAHLLDRRGERDLVAEVAAGANHARVHELARDPRLGLALAGLGLSVEDAAAIQPLYCSCPSFDPVDTCACSLPGLGALIVGSFTTIDGERALVVEEAYGDAPEQPGEIITSWIDGTHAYVSHIDGTRVLVARVSGTQHHLLYEVWTDASGEHTVDTSSCEACMPVTQPPPAVPLQVFIDVAEGRACEEAFAELPGWERQPGSHCPPPEDEDPSGGGPSDGSGGAAPSATTSTGGAGPASPPPDGDGCSVGSTLDPSTAALLGALVAGLAAARLRRAAPRS